MFILLTLVIFSDNLCTKVTNKVYSSNTKDVRYTCKFTFLAAHVMDKDCTNYQHTSFM